MVTMISGYNMGAFIYGAMALRIYIASKWDDFKSQTAPLQLDLSAMKPEVVKSLKESAHFALWLLVLCWPFFLIAYPKSFICAFVLGKKAAINVMNLYCGFKVGATLALFRKFFNKLDR